MKYTAVSVRQLERKGKPWQARAKYKDVYGKWKEVSKMLPEAKGKKEANRMAKEWLEKLNAEADLMPNAGKAKTVDEIYKEYLQHQLATGEIERSTYSNSLVDAYGKKIEPHGLRHNFATVGIRAGMDIASLALMMGHASRAMTLDTYGDANADALTLASVKLKDTFNDNTDYYKLEEEQEDTEEEYGHIRCHKNRKLEFLIIFCFFVIFLRESCVYR